ncbi:MAG: Dcm methylase [Acidobacteria bacterium]|nr:Dcm methylase [Acidobacteriota bacterium]|tara:strand:- start:33479 stop:34174 length:696 start_codon:yes stop_codon:yes gene_type:complete
MIVLSLYDHSGVLLHPWARAGYECHAYDIKHVDHRQRIGDNVIHFHKADLHDLEQVRRIIDTFQGKEVVFGAAFPVCTDLAVSGIIHWPSKEGHDPDFQYKAARYAIWCRRVFTELQCPWFIENPKSRLSSLWRKPDYKFHPYEYGGYLPEDDEHPTWPQYIAPRDAYPKETYLWTGGGFKMPPKKKVIPEDGYSRQYGKIGGSHPNVKEIRSMTPRGFSIANYQANRRSK